MVFGLGVILIEIQKKKLGRFLRRRATFPKDHRSCHGQKWPPLHCRQTVGYVKTLWDPLAIPKNEENQQLPWT